MNLGLGVSGGSKNFEKGAEDNLSAPSSIIANAHNEIYAFYTEKSGFLNTYAPPPLNPSLLLVRFLDAALERFTLYLVYICSIKSRIFLQF